MYAMISRDRFSPTDCIVETAAGITHCPDLTSALTVAREAFGLAADRAKRWPATAELVPPTVPTRGPAKPARKRRKARKTVARRKARKAAPDTCACPPEVNECPKPRRCKPARKAPAMASVPRDRSAAADTAPADKVWRVSRPDGSFLVESRSRSDARERSASNQNLAGLRIRLRARLVLNRARRQATADRPAVAKKTTGNRSAKIRRQRSASETRVLTAARDRR
jgi:hypothetical protein